MTRTPTAPFSIKDVAALASVSLGTVSNVLNRPEMVRPATRARVEQAIDELGFVPNASARQLVAGRSDTIAYLVYDVANPFFTDVARGIDEVARASGLSLFICNSDQDAGREDEYLAQLSELRVRGVLITAMDYHNLRLRQLHRQGVPVVLVDRAPDGVEDWCTVGVDDVAGGEMAIDHLVDIGHRRIAFVGGPLDLPQVADRAAGVDRAAVRAGIDPDSVTSIRTPALSVADGRLAGDRLLSLSRVTRPTGVFCANDLVALGLLQHLTQHDVRVPDDMAIVGYDDIDFAAAAAVPLSSVAQPRQLLGRAAAALLVEESEHGTDHKHRHIVFTPNLVARASTVKGRA